MSASTLNCSSHAGSLHNRIEFGDCRETMRRWAAEGIKAQTCVTSPPYFGLRDYGHEGQIGLEQTPEEYIAAMVEVFRCVRDVLADDGTLWLNIGDSYAASTRNLGRNDAGRNFTGGGGNKEGSGNPGKQGAIRVVMGECKPKDLIGIPWLLAFALRSDGWYLRQDIIWHKPNPMPESVRDRCTKAHEYVFLFSKAERYFFDSEAMKEPATGNASGAAASFKRAGSKREQTIPGQGYGTHRPEREDVAYNETRNRRSVWTVATRPYKGAHFATFPPALIEPCVLAGTSERGHCPECGARWVREVKRHTSFEGGSGKAGRTADEVNASGKHIGGIHGGNKNLKLGPVVRSTTTGWRPTCSCGHAPVPDIVLDPFMGSGTTAAVALQHGRRYLGCELNPAYGPLQDGRIAAARLANEKQPDLFGEAA